MFSTEMMFRELEEKLQRREAVIDEVTADRTTLLRCWMSAVTKLKELGYKPKMSPDKDSVEEWLCIEQE